MVSHMERKNEGIKKELWHEEKTLRNQKTSFTTHVQTRQLTIERGACIKKEKESYAQMGIKFKTSRVLGSTWGITMQREYTNVDFEGKREKRARGIKLVEGGEWRGED